MLLFLRWGQVKVASNQDGRVVKVLHSRCNGHKSSWVRIPLLVLTLTSLGYNKKRNIITALYIICFPSTLNTWWPCCFVLSHCRRSLSLWVSSCPGGVIYLRLSGGFTFRILLYLFSWMTRFYPSARSNRLKTNINKRRCPLCYLGRHFQQPRMINRLWFLPFS